MVAYKHYLNIFNHRSTFSAHVGDQIEALASMLGMRRRAKPNRLSGPRTCTKRDYVYR
jgi:hypothetical protein